MDLISDFQTHANIWSSSEQLVHQLQACYSTGLDLVDVASYRQTVKETQIKNAYLSF